MIPETKLGKKLGEFFSRLFQNKKEKKEQDAKLLKESYDLLLDLARTWNLPQAERKDLVDYTNLLLQKAKEIRIHKNKAIAHDIKRFAERNCLAGVIPDSELERVHRETEELIENMKTAIEIT